MQTGSIKTCPRCNAPHELPGIYCSRICANIRVHTAESKSKISKSVSAHKAHSPMSKELSAEIGRKVSKTLFTRLLEKPFDELTKTQKKKIVLAEQEGRCLWCGLSEWLGKPITFELDHIDGDNQNNGRSNLRVLCPNCHSQTPTWRRAKTHPFWLNQK